MKENKQDIDNSLRQALKDVALESPSNDFTFNVMDEINAIESSQAFTYSSLIPNPIKIVLGLVVVCLLTIFSFFVRLEFTINLPEYIKLPQSFFKPKVFDFFLLTDYSNVILYAGSLFMLMFAFQIYTISKRVALT